MGSFLKKLALACSMGNQGSVGPHSAQRPTIEAGIDNRAGTGEINSDSSATLKKDLLRA